ncbi:MAG: CBS domain-containing protein [candidate division WOR-3 bacterium]|nr:CBS domain-containing protein [candidate division WOR-3 bacterium]MCX7947221.1 CBS domain-containing protein [candidate division WOR-3 bacterium]MDW8150276.1 CBS domain-containing protein [candidate division WOR-3 bacterium]
MEILVLLLFLAISFVSSGFEAGYLKSERSYNIQKDNIFISTTLFINTLANSFGAIYFSIIIGKIILDENLKYLLEILLFTAIVLIFCETLPKSVAFYYPNFFYNSIFRTIYWNVGLIFSPIFHILNKIFPFYRASSERYIGTKDILLPLKYIIERGFWKEQRALIAQELISLMKSDIKTFIKPASEVETISYESKVKDVVRLYKSKNYRFYPVYKETKHNIVGIVDISELINANVEESIKNYIKEPVVLLDSFPVMKFLKMGYRFSVVYDEFGNFLGIATRKEILRNVFNIYSPNIRKISENVYIISSPIDLGLIEEITGVYLGEPNRNFNEFLIEKGLDSILEGEEIYFENLKITILSKNNNYVEKIKLEIS